MSLFAIKMIHKIAARIQLEKVTGWSGRYHSYIIQILFSILDGTGNVAVLVGIDSAIRQEELSMTCCGCFDVFHNL